MEDPGQINIPGQQNSLHSGEKFKIVPLGNLV